MASRRERRPILLAYRLETPLPIPGPGPSPSPFSVRSEYIRSFPFLPKPCSEDARVAINKGNRVMISSTPAAASPMREVAGVVLLGGGVLMQ